MTTPALSDPRQASQIHLEIVEDIIEVIQETFPAAATLDCHRQMRDILIRIRDTLHHPVLFAAHIIVYLVKAARFSRRWATLVKNIASLDPLLLKRRSSALYSPSSVPSPHNSLLNPHSVIPNPQSAIPNPRSSALSTQHSALSFRHSIETRLRIRAFAQALQHERHLAEKLPPSVPKPDLTPILLSPRRHRSVLSSQSSVLSTQSSLLSPQSSALSPFLHSPLFPSEAFWESKVRRLQLKILGNITRVLPNVYRAYLKQYNASISSTPSTSSTPSIPSHPSHPSYPSHSSPASVLSTQSSVLSSHPPPHHPQQI